MWRRGGSGEPGSGWRDATPIGGTFSGFFGGTAFAPSFNDNGDMLFLCDVDGGSSPRGLFLYLADSGSIVKVAAVGDTSPVGGVLGAVGPGTLNSSREVVFLAQNPGSGSINILHWRDGSMSCNAEVGDPAPGGEVFSFLGTEIHGFVDGTSMPGGPVPSINEQGQIAFRAYVDGGPHPGA